MYNNNIYTHVYIYIHIHIHTRMCIYIYIYIYTHTCIYLYIYIYTYISTVSKIHDVSIAVMSDVSKPPESSPTSRCGPRRSLPY